MTSHIGIYSGTFDPVHQGHLAFCLKTIEQGKVDQVIIIPERFPRNKPKVTSLSTRLLQLDEVIKQFPSVRVVSLVSERFTVKETLPELRERFDDVIFSLMIGSDVVATLPYWNDLDLLLDEVQFIVGMRRSDAIGEVKGIMKEIGRTYDKSIHCQFIEANHADVASSYIRSGEMIADFSSLHTEKSLLA